MNESYVVGATVYTNISQFPRGIVFDLCIVDEAGQITEPSILQVLMLSRQVVLVGDSKQLPPLVHSAVSSINGLSKSLLARLEETYEKLDSYPFITSLVTQYRMNTQIMSLANYLIYGNAMKAANSLVANATLSISINFTKHIWLQSLLMKQNSVIFLNTDLVFGDERFESSTMNSNSKRNYFEARMVKQMIDAFIEGGVACSSIGVISPYAAQVTVMSNQLIHYTKPYFHILLLIIGIYPIILTLQRLVALWKFRQWISFKFDCRMKCDN
jgi:DNA replication ATP-dependent helicase Dna2